MRSVTAVLRQYEAVLDSLQETSLSTGKVLLKAAGLLNSSLEKSGDNSWLKSRFPGI